jgi:SAM-dependent methyltransferase
MPSTSTLASFYPPGYHSLRADGLLVRLRNDIRWRRLRKLLRNPSSTVLDFGCGDGQFLDHVAKREPDARLFGYEIGAKAEVERRAGGRITIVRGDVDDLIPLLPRCELITMNHVIEHLPDPVQTLSLLAGKLAPGGIVEGQTPAAGSLEHRLFGDRWSGYHAPRHTVVFSPRGLRAAGGPAGLEHARIQGTFNPAGLALSLASLRHPAGPARQVREGAGWLFWLALATALSIVDRLSGAPAVIDFDARRGAL